MPADLLIYKDIGDYWDGLSSSDVASSLKEIGNTDALNVRINSVGGDVGHGTAIRSLLVNYARQQKALNPDFVMKTYVDGYCYSIASVIAHNGSEIIMAEGSSMMIHRAWSLSFGNCAEMRKAADVLEMHDSNIADVYVASTGKKKEDILALMDAETWFTAQQAVEAKFANRVDVAKAKISDSINAALRNRAPGDYSKFMHARAQQVSETKKTNLNASARLALLELMTDASF